MNSLPKILVLMAAAAAAALGQQSYDLVVYGATAGGVATAVAGARHGLKTVLVGPGRHVGGMATGGLSRSDIGRREVIGGLALEFYFRVGRKYQMERFNQPVAWFYEPKVGEAVMLEMLQEAGVRLELGHRLKESGGVRREGPRIREIAMEDGARFRGQVFADCSYEGDLMAQARVSYTFGRESIAQYGEALAGIRDRTPFHQFATEVAARDAGGALLPEISAEPRGKAGEADKRIQAYNFRIIGTDDPDNRIAWPKPEGYDAKRYELLARVVEGLTKQKGRAPVFHEVTLIARIPNRKADFNNNGAFSTDYIGKNYAYPDGSYERRDQIWKEHEDYVKGFFYFLANDPRIPRDLQDEVRQWGLPKDEYQDSNGWPHQLYIREARRMIGEYVMTQKDLQTERTKPDVIGMGSYNSDSHNVRRFVNEQGLAENEGDMQVSVQPYQIPYRVMLPRAAEAGNLLVPVCFSASHVAYSSLRMEPQYMIIGHAAGVAAAMAVRGAVPVQKIAVEALQKTLRDEAAVFQHVATDHDRAIRMIRERRRPKGVLRANYE